MYEVVQRLDLDVNYVEKGLFHGKTLYGTAAPYVVKFHNLKPEQGGGFRITINPDGSAMMEKFVVSTPTASRRSRKPSISSPVSRP